MTIIRKPGQQGVKPQIDMWEPAPSEFIQRCVFMDIMGSESSGKTTLALSAPGPIALIHANEKINGVVQPWVRKGKIIKVHRYGFVASKDPQETATRAQPVWLAARQAAEDAYGWARSTVLDTGTNYWEMIRLARFGTLNPKGRNMGHLYTAVNNEFRTILAHKYRNQERTNIITIHQTGDKWINKMVEGQMQGFNTGVPERKGMKEIGFMCEVGLHCWKNIEDGTYHTTINKGWFNGAVEGMDLTDELMVQMGYSGMNFSGIMGFITQTDELEWAV